MFLNNNQTDHVFKSWLPDVQLDDFQVGDSLKYPLNSAVLFPQLIALSFLHSEGHADAEEHDQEKHENAWKLGSKSE